MLVQNKKSGLNLIKSSLNILKFTNSVSFYNSGKQYYQEILKLYHIDIHELS